MVDWRAPLGGQDAGIGGVPEEELDTHDGLSLLNLRFTAGFVCTKRHPVDYVLLKLVGGWISRWWEMAAGMTLSAAEIGCSKDLLSQSRQTTAPLITAAEIQNTEWIVLELINYVMHKIRTWVLQCIPSLPIVIGKAVNKA
jgi:hypothetical protein